MNNILPGVSEILVYNLSILISFLSLFLTCYFNMDKQQFNLWLIFERFTVYFHFFCTYVTSLAS